jgi:hypothetical protein
MSSSSKELRRKLQLKRYLAELAAVTGRQIQADELIGLEQTTKLQADQQKFRTQSFASYEVPLSHITTKRFIDFIDRLSKSNNSNVYLWIMRSMDCGVIRLQSLYDVAWGLDLSASEEGILVFVTDDLEDSLLLDFSELPTGEQIMTIETKGANWESVTY